MDAMLRADINKVKTIKCRIDEAISEGKTFDEVKEVYLQLNVLIAEIDAKWAVYEDAANRNNALSTDILKA